MAAKRGRKPGFKMGEEHRTKIRNSQILKYLIEHAEGKREMSQSQASVGLGLIKKVLPDLSSVELEGGEKPIEFYKTIEIVGVKATRNYDDDE